MSYFDQKQLQYTEVLNLIDQTILLGGSIQDIRDNIASKINEIDEIKSKNMSKTSAKKRYLQLKDWLPTFVKSTPKSNKPKRESKLEYYKRKGN